MRRSLLLLFILAGGPAFAGDCGKKFNCYVVSAAHRMVSERASAGYCAKGSSTRDLDYGTTKNAIPQLRTKYCSEEKGRPNGISCNGAVFEILLEALRDYSVANKFVGPLPPVEAWTSTSLRQIRAHIFLYEPRSMEPFSRVKFKRYPGVVFNAGGELEDFSRGLRSRIRDFESKSIAQGLHRFGMADPIKLADLRPGDVITFNRDVNKVIDGDATDQPDGSQHSAIFLSWLDADQQDQGSYSNAKGFKYISSQTNWGGKAGFGVKWAYFTNFCPQDPQNVVEDSDTKHCPDQRKKDDGSSGVKFPRQLGRQKSDCCVVPKDGGLTLEGVKGGRIRAPGEWKTAYDAHALRVAQDLNELVKDAERERKEWLENTLAAKVAGDASPKDKNVRVPAAAAADISIQEEPAAAADFDE